MSLLRPRKHPKWMPRYSRPPGTAALFFVLALVLLLIWFLFRF
jgi:hypothetical protein